MLDFFVELCPNPIWAVLIVSMIPSLESKVALPLGLASFIWGEATLSPVAAFVIALLGSTIPSFFVILLAKFIKKRATGFVFERFMSKYNASKMQTKQTVWQKCLFISTFVAIPLPLTGVYTGGLIAGLSNLKIWQGIFSVFIGQVVSCTIILLLCLYFENSIFYVLIISLILIAIYLAVNFCMRFFSKIKKEKR